MPIRSPHTASEVDLVRQFWDAPLDALFTQKILAPVLRKSEAWLERCRWSGQGIAFVKLGRGVVYRKRDVVAWLNLHPINTSTSEYTAKLSVTSTKSA